MNKDLARLCGLAQKTFELRKTSTGYDVIRRSNGKLQTNPKAVKMGKKVYNRNTIINYCLNRAPAPKGSAPAFTITTKQSLFFSRCIDLLFATILRVIGSNVYQLFDAVSFIVHELYTELAHKGHRYRQKLYATPKGYRRQCAVLNGVLSFGECMRIMLAALRRWKPVTLSRERRRQANALTKNFLSLLSQVRRDERHYRFDAVLCVLHIVMRDNPYFKKRVRTGEVSMWDAGMDAVEAAMSRSLEVLQDSIRPPQVGPVTHARVSSGYYTFCRKRLYSCMELATFLEQYKYLEYIPMFMNDLGMYVGRGHVRYGVNHLLMAINETGRMEEFLEYFAEQVRNRPRLNMQKGRYLRGVRNAGLVWRFTQKHVTKATGFVDVDVIRAVRAKTGRPIELAKPTAVKNALMELAEEIPTWRTLGSLNVSCE